MDDLFVVSNGNGKYLAYYDSGAAYFTENWNDAAFFCEKKSAENFLQNSIIPKKSFYAVYRVSMNLA